MSVELIIVPVLAPALVGTGRAAVSGGLAAARAVNALSERIADEIARQREADRRLREERLALRTETLERADRRAAAIQTLESLHLDLEDSARIERDAVIERIRLMLAALAGTDSVDSFRGQLDALESDAASNDCSEDSAASLLRLEAAVSKVARQDIEASLRAAPSSSRPSARRAALWARLSGPAIQALPEARRVAEAMRPAVEKLATYAESESRFAMQQLSLLERQLEEAIEDSFKMQSRRQHGLDRLRDDAAVARGTLVALFQQAPTERIATEARSLLRGLERALATASADLLPDISRLCAAAQQLRARAETELASEAQREAMRVLLREALRDLEEEYEISEIPEDPSQPSYVVAMKQGLGAQYRIKSDGSIHGELVRIEGQEDSRGASPSRAEMAQAEEEVCKVADRVVGSLDRRGVSMQSERRRSLSHFRLASVRLPQLVRDQDHDPGAARSNEPLLMKRED